MQLGKKNSPPSSINRILPNLLFLLILPPLSNNGSVIRSVYRLVKTVVGISPMPNNLEVTICAPNCIARNTNGNNSQKSTSPLTFFRACGLDPGIAPPWTNPAARKTAAACRMKDVKSVPRLDALYFSRLIPLVVIGGLCNVERRYVNTAPNMKQIIAVSDFNHP